MPGISVIGVGYGSGGVLYIPRVLPDEAFFSFLVGILYSDIEHLAEILAESTWGS
jgi:hypothetical protein